MITRPFSSSSISSFLSLFFLPDGKFLKTDVVVAKNHLNKYELKSLGGIVNAYLDLAEERARRRIPMTMEDWAKRLDA